MKKDTIRTLTLLLCLAAMLVGCGNKPEASSPASNQPSVVRLNLSSEPDSLHPWKSAASDTEAIFDNVFEGLLGFDQTGALVPALAKEWSISPDGLTYTFQLSENVTFHNGAAFSSKDVFDSYLALAGLNGEKPISSKFGVIRSIDAPDASTFSVTLREPSAAFLGYTTIPILPSGYDKQEAHPIGTGPFSFVEYVPAQKVVLEKYESYYRPERMAKIDRAEVYIMSDPGAVLSALRSGQLDMAQVTPNDAATLGDGFTVHTYPQNMVQLFALNNSIKPFDDIRVRQAINFAVDKQEIIDGAFDGHATALTSNFSPVMKEYYNDSLEGIYSLDLERAKALLTDAGYQNGFTMTVSVPANYHQHVSTAMILAQQLSKIGITLEVKPIEWATWLEDVYSNANYESTVVGLTGKLDPDGILHRFVSDFPKNFVRFDSKAYDALIRNALTELDTEKRIADYKECQRLLTEQAAAVFLCDPHLAVATKSELVGFTYYPVTFYDLSALSYQA